MSENRVAEIIEWVYVILAGGILVLTVVGMIWMLASAYSGLVKLP